MNKTSCSTILVVDDIIDNLLLTELYLEDYSVMVDTAENGEEAVKMAATNSYDLILMDIRMPVMDGIRATETIRKHEQQGNKTQVVVAVTAEKEELRDELHHSPLSDFDGVLGKPFARKELIEILQRFIGAEKVHLSPEKLGNKTLGYCLENTIPEKLPQAVARLRRGVLQNMAGLLSQLREGFDREHPQDLDHSVHSLKGVSGMFGFEQFSTTLADFSDALELQQPEEAGRVLEKLELQLQSLQKIHGKR
jgi:CheY-like chemotaxis protein